MISGMWETSLNAAYSDGKVCKGGGQHTGWSLVVLGNTGRNGWDRMGFLAPRHGDLLCSLRDEGSGWDGL